MDKSPQATRPRKVHGRKHGRPLRNVRLQALDALLPRLEIPQTLLKEDGTLDPAEIFATPPGVLHFEIGFGNGEHLVDLMAAHPGDFVIGAEPYTNGVSAFLASVRDTPPLDHCRILMDDALRILHSLKDACIDYLYILNPDPWPKSRHHKRRMVNADNLTTFARVLKDGGTMIQTTDVAELAGWMASLTSAHPAFDWQAETPRDWQTPPDGWLPTRYESKGREAGRIQSYLVYKRRPR